ncbi:hypothetical protein G6F50_017400 [Rhizopus delemar]|uniref:Uncharacterized protein n=1 Tax=Rhizopus delemar TaxID=936053 RepID=A0A9P7C084_9FUNG|nr:hypothetical protein G6F50_017400 [Rhizopus delemar]
MRARRKASLHSQYRNRIAQYVTVRQGDGAFDELVVQRPCDVDALDAAAGLARIEEGAVAQGVDRVVQLGVGSHIGRIVAAQLQAYTDKAPRRAFLDDAPAAHRSGK